MLRPSTGFAAHAEWIRPVATLFVIAALATVFSPRDAQGALVFWQPANLSNLFRQIAEVGILSMGMTLVILSAGIDLSVGAVLALASTVFAQVLTVYTGAHPALVAAASAMAAALAVGLINGIAITRLRLQPFIVTLATMIAARGFARWLVDNQTIAVGYDERTRPAIEAIRYRPVVIGAFLAITALCLVLLSATRFGRYIRAIGGAESAARLSGIQVSWVKVRVYALCAAIAGVAGIVSSAQNFQGSPTAGTAYELDAIAAAVIGGSSLAGGRGGIVGTFVGALALGILTQLLGLRNVEENVQWMLKGGIIIGAVWLQQAGRKPAH